MTEPDTTTSIWRSAKYRQTVLFAITALLVMAIAALIAATKINGAIAGLAEAAVISLAEENATKDARHIQSMITGAPVMEAMVTGVQGIAINDHAVTIGSGVEASVEPMVMGPVGPVGSSDMDVATSVNDTHLDEVMPLTVGLLTGANGLPSQFAHLVEGMGILESTLFSPAGDILWSTDLKAVGLTMVSSPGLRDALAGNISSELERNLELTGHDGSVVYMDVVETYVPLQDSPTSPIVGVLEINREVGADLGALVGDTKVMIVWTTVATMSGLFLALVGFVVLSDRMIYQSNRRQLDLVEGQFAERDRAQKELAEQARALSASNQELELATEQLMKTQDNLVRTEKLAAIGQLSGGLAHDLRNPLGSIKNAVYLIKKKMDSGQNGAQDASVIKYLGIIEGQTARSERVIENLMSFARVSPFVLVPAGVNRVVNEALDSFVRRDNVKLLTDVDSDLGSVMADVEQLQRVFLNLANNAQEAMLGGGELTVSGRLREGQVEVLFADTGGGIARENMEKLFDPLFTTKPGGTGLGLAVCREIIGHHGGTVDAANNAEPKGGATFAVLLPSLVE